ncbi:MAG: DUF4832 domain-containing protein [Clostridiales bacterium]|nr:DUF4832 domain-containing protein [Clostridiales bacterium]
MAVNRPRKLSRIRIRLRPRPEGSRPLGEARMRAFGVARGRTLLVIPALLIAVIVAAWGRVPGTTTARYRPIEQPIANPMIGWALSAQDLDSPYDDATLVYVRATWRELEPEMGEYDFEGFEEKNHLAEWWGRGARLVLRVVADAPGEAGHRDIPDWLYDATGGSGTQYETPEGAGFSPEYDDLFLRERHRLLLSALGARYDAHPGVAYVELGSLGHDGAWRLGEGAGALPLAGVSRSYTRHYTDALSRTLLLMCRPYREAKKLGLGLYNPALEDADATWSLLDDVKVGGFDEQIMTDLYPMEGFWASAPSGAHWSAAGALAAGDLVGLVRRLSEGHVSYVALDRPLGQLTDGELDAMRGATLSIGYRLWIRSATWDTASHPGYRASVKLEVRNDGVAPIYGDWRPTLALFWGGNCVLAQAAELDIGDALPGRTEFSTWLDVPATMREGSYTLRFALIDPETGQPAVRLAMAECGPDLWTSLGVIKIKSAR